MTAQDLLYIGLGFLGALILAVIIPQEWLDVFGADSPDDLQAKYHYNAQDEIDALRYGDDSVKRGQFKYR